MKQQKNIWLLPTDKPSRLHIWENEKGLRATLYDKPQLEIPNTGKNIYITNSEEIKEDYVIAYGVVIKVMMFDKETLYFVNGTKAKREECKKIILTTDQDLIKDGVKEIDNEFLQWYVNNPSCEWVETKHIIKEYVDDQDAYGYDVNYYKIVIPKQENNKEKQPNFYNELQEYFKNTPKEKILEDWNKSAKYDKVGITVEDFLNNQIKCYCGHTNFCDCSPLKEPKQETLEEFISNSNTPEGLDQFSYDKGLEDGVKWKEEQDKKLYNEEEVKNLFIERAKEFGTKMKTFDELLLKQDLDWFEKNKKK